ncbi:MAG TPA: glycosyl transferase family 2, partial [Dongiaceae bacterium]
MVLWLLTLLPLLAWLYLLAFHGGFWRSDQCFVPSSIPGLSQWPAVAAIVPARNEVDTIADVLRSLMA